MKGKCITVILTLAVLLGLLLVPAMGISVSAGDPGATKATFLMPAEVKVLPGQAFAVDVTLYNPNTIKIYTACADMVWSTPAMLNVTGIDGISWPTELLKGWDNATGEVYVSAAGSIPSPYQNATNIAQCTVHFVAGSTEGTVTVSFTPAISGETVIYDVGSNDICNWSAMQNMTVIIGSPKLTVTKVGNGGVNANGVPLVFASSNTTNRSWNDNVTLAAIPAAGWEFSSWTGVDGPNAASTWEIMDNLAEDVTVTFTELPPILDVDPLSLDFSARFGNSNQSKTVEISNTGGGTLCWALGDPPTWTPGDVWSYWNTYDTYPPTVPFPNPYWSPLVPCAVNDTVLNLTVVSQDANYYYGFADWPITDPQRTASSIYGPLPVCMQNSSVVVNKCTLDYVSQLANLTIYLGGPNPGQALVTWSYNGCHGWPYYVGKTWTYTMTVTDVTGTTVHNAQAVVTGTATVGGFPCYVITHFAPTYPSGTIFMQQYWSNTVRNFVYQWDGGTFNAPPLDERSLLSFSVAAPPSAVPPAWLSFDKTHGSLGIGGSELLTVTANTSGLNVTPPLYTGSFDITAPGSIQVETVDVSLEVLPATTIDVMRNLPADAMDLDAETIGDVFDVWVNFTAPVNNFATIGLTDLAPAGWDVQTNVAWCSPVASWTMSPGNKAEYAWAGNATGYPVGTPFSAMYRVTIPATAKNGLNDWPNNDGTKAWAEYWFGAVGPYTSNVTGEWQKMVTIPGKVVGETRDVNADLLTTTLVVLSENPPEALDEPEDSDSSTAPDALYEVWADDTGQYWMEASKYCYFSLDTNTMPTPRNPLYALYIDFGTTAKLYAGSALDFEGDYGLVPKACTMSYAMKSVNHWLFVPVDGGLNSHSEWQLSVWKAMESVHSWQFPAGCNT